MGGLSLRYRRKATEQGLTLPRVSCVTLCSGFLRKFLGWVISNDVLHINCPRQQPRWGQCWTGFCTLKNNEQRVALCSRALKTLGLFCCCCYGPEASEYLNIICGYSWMLRELSRQTKWLISKENVIEGYGSRGQGGMWGHVRFGSWIPILCFGYQFRALLPF